MVIVSGNSTSIYSCLGHHHVLTLIVNDTRCLVYCEQKCMGTPATNYPERGTVCLPVSNQRTVVNKYSLLMHCIKIKSPAKFLLNEQYVFVGGNIYFLCVLSCSSEEA